MGIGNVFVVSVCVCLRLFGLQLLNELTHFWYDGTSYQGQAQVSRSLGRNQGHMLESANLASQTSVSFGLTCLRSKI